VPEPASWVTLRAVPEPSKPSSPSENQPLSFFARLIFAWSCYFRVLFDPAFAQRAWIVRDALPTHPELPPPPARPELPPPASEKPVAKLPEAPSTTSALQLLALLQREGRLVDFLEQDVAGFPDAEIGAAVRVVHEGCRRALRGHMKIKPIRAEEEGVKVAIPEGYDPAELKLTGNVQGGGPYRGTLQHRGWRASEVVLPTPVKGHDPSVLAPAEVEL
jgi:hypothetical protein